MGNIQSIEDQKYLLGDMLLAENRGRTSIFDQLEHLKHMLIDMPTTWSIIDIPLKKEFSTLWELKYGKWLHGTRKVGTHNNLGMAFAWYMLENKAFREIALSDSPDFRAIFTHMLNGKSEQNINISGDIGRCTFIAIMQGLQRLENIHDLWVSVLDWSTIIVIEFHYSPSVYYHYKLKTRPLSSILPFHLNNLTNKELTEIFYCNYCKQWTIQDKPLEELKTCTWED